MSEALHVGTIWVHLERGADTYMRDLVGLTLLQGTSDEELRDIAELDHGSAHHSLL